MTAGAEVVPPRDDLTRACRDELRGWTADALDDPEQADLRATYLEWIDGHDRPWSRDCAGSHLTGSALVVDPATRKVALVFHGKARMWLQTGGHLEATDAHPAEAALREATEETGLSGLTVLPGPTRLSRHPAPCGTADWHLDLQYTVLAGSDTALGGDEADVVAWCDPDALPEPTDDAVRSLVSASLARLTALGPAGQPSPTAVPDPSDQPSR